MSWLSRTSVVKKKTWGLFNGSIFVIVNTNTPKTTTALANTNVISLDIKIGGSTRFCTKFSPLIKWIVEKNTSHMQEKIANTKSYFKKCVAETDFCLAWSGKK
jgi:hypothetical protein